MEHDPLGGSGDAVVAFIQGRQASQNSVVIVSHFDVFSKWRCLVFGVVSRRLGFGIKMTVQPGVEPLSRWKWVDGSKICSDALSGTP